MTDQTPRARFRTSQLEDAAGPGRNPTGNPTMGEIIAARFSRRAMLKGSMAATAIAATVGPMAMLAAGRARAAGAAGSRFSFPEVAAGVDADHHVAEGYDADVLLRWGDPIFPDFPEFDPAEPDAEAQARQFGYNNDYVGYIPIDGSSEHGLLVVNHEYTNEHLMFPGVVTIAEAASSTIADADQKRVDIEMAAHGGSVVEIRKVDGKWQVVRDGAAEPPHHRRDPDAAHRPRRRPRAPADRRRPDRHPGPRHDQQLRRRRDALGHLRSWPRRTSTAISSATLPEGHPEAANYERYGVPEGTYAWGSFHDRFDVSQGAERAQPLRLDRRGRRRGPDLGRRRSAPRSAASSTRAARAS